MSLTLLLDLDDTLLDTNLDVFVPAYFQALSNHLADHAAPSTMFRALIDGMNLMSESEDPTQTLEEVFDADFYTKLGVSKHDLIHIIEEFYDDVFPQLRQHTQPRPDAVRLIDWAVARGYRIAIATDPLFPRKATYHRLRWAGFDPERFELVSTIEHFHFTKTHPAYFAEVLGRLGWPEGPILMVGNDIARDLAPAHRLGLKTFFVDGESGSSPGPSPAFPGTARQGRCVPAYGARGCAPGASVDAAQGEFVAGRGKLAELRPWLESINLSSLEPSFRSREAILGIMVSTPAVLRSLCLSLAAAEWRKGPTSDDWAMNEIICHLRDTEREIHQMQLELMIEREGAFIPRPDSGIWANEREYLNVDGKTALSEFARSRVANVKILKGLEDEIWARSARHAIFGPTNFLEVVSFMADHDRLHIHQAWKTLKSV